MRGRRGTIHRRAKWTRKFVIATLALALLLAFIPATGRASSPPEEQASSQTQGAVEAPNGPTTPQTPAAKDPGAAEAPDGRTPDAAEESGQAETPDGRTPPQTPDTAETPDGQTPDTAEIPDEQTPKAPAPTETPTQSAASVEDAPPGSSTGAAADGGEAPADEKTAQPPEGGSPGDTSSKLPVYKRLDDILNGAGKGPYILPMAAFAQITEKYVTSGGGVLQADTTVSLALGVTYQKTITAIEGYTIKGYKVGPAAPTGAGDYTPVASGATTVSIPGVTANMTIWFVYELKPAKYDIDLNTSDESELNRAGYYSYVPGKKTLLISNDYTGADRNNYSAAYRIWQSGTAGSKSIKVDSIEVQTGVNTKIILDGVNVTSSTAGTPAFNLKDAARVSLILAGDNYLIHNATTSEQKNYAGLYVPTGTAITIGGIGSLTAQGGYGSAGIGGGGNPNSDDTIQPYKTAGTIDIISGHITATGKSGGAGIGGGRAGGSGGTITIRGTAYVEASGGSGNAAGAGIGGGFQGHGGTITIAGGTVVAKGGGGAGIGGGPAGSGGRTTITGGKVTAYSVSGAGIGGGRISGGTIDAGSGGTIIIGGDADVTAYATYSKSAGIGGGDYVGKVSYITIGGIAKVVATGGVNGGAGIGSGGDNAGIASIIDISSTASIRAYSYIASKPAIHAEPNLGDGFYVNAYFKNPNSNFPSYTFPSSAPPSTTSDTALEVYAGGVLTNTLTLPKGYACFAYTTNATTTQNDNILAYSGDNTAFLGAVVRAKDDVSAIPSTKSDYDQPYVYFLYDALPVKFGNGVSGPWVTDITTKSAVFNSRGHSYPDQTVTWGGFRYTHEKDASGALSGPAILKWTSLNGAGAKRNNATGLEPNTRYFMDAYLKTTNGDFKSGAVPFCTLPYITSASIRSAGVTTASVSAIFYESALGPQYNATIQKVNIYWSENTIKHNQDYSSVTSAAVLNALPITDYNSSGFTHELIGLTPGATYHILIVIENEGGGMADYYLEYTPPTTLKITKRVTGSYASKSKAFEFTIYFKDSGGNPLAENTPLECTGGAITGVTPPMDKTLRLDTDGKATFSLAHGQTLMIKNAPAKGQVQIVEDPTDFYEASFTDSYGTALAPVGKPYDTGLSAMTSAARSFEFLNTRKAVTPVGINTGDDDVPRALPALAVLLAVATLLITRKARRRARRAETR
jgi:hypothetical protein